MGWLMDNPIAELYGPAFLLLYAIVVALVVWHARRSLGGDDLTADHYLDASPEKLAELDLLAAHFPLIPHGLNLSLGSAEGLDLDYLSDT